MKRAANQIYYQCNYAYDVAVRTDIADAFVTKLNADTGFGGYNDDRHVRGVCVCVCMCVCGDGGSGSVGKCGEMGIRL